MVGWNALCSDQPSVNLILHIFPSPPQADEESREVLCYWLVGLATSDVLRLSAPQNDVITGYLIKTDTQLLGSPYPPKGDAQFIL